MAIYAIGDVHGHYDGLMRLLDKIGYGDDDELWFVGDLVNRGPDSAGVLRFVAGLNQKKVVLGNHDIALLIQAQHFPEFKIKKTTKEVLQAADGEALIDQLRYFPLLHADSRLQILMTHAGLFPQWTLEQGQKASDAVSTQLRSSDYRNFLRHIFGDKPRLWSEKLQGTDYLSFAVKAFCRMRYLDKDGGLNLEAKMSPQDASKNLHPWYSVKQNCHWQQLFGHWSTLGVYVHKNIICLDGGYAWGGSMVAYNVEAKTFAGKILFK